MTKEQQPHLVHTTFEHGFTDQDLEKAIKHTSLLESYKEIPVMIRQNQKIIDTYLYYNENPYPFLSIHPGISEVESESRKQWRETFGYKYQ